MRGFWSVYLHLKNTNFLTTSGKMLVHLSHERTDCYEKTLKCRLHEFAKIKES
jgi:hypothetical protein